MDSILGLAIAMLAANLLASSLSPTPSAAPSLRASAACYDMANYIYSDEDFYRNITSQLGRDSRISNSSLSLLRGRLRYYGEVLGLSSVDFSMGGMQNEHIGISEGIPVASEKCCFPLPADGGRRVPTSCLEVFT